MGTEVNLLARYPKARRSTVDRRRDKEACREVALRFGQEYFDGTREQGYGGYRYDGRWIPIAEDIVAHFGLKAGDRVLDVGCAKGFLVKDLMAACPGLSVFGVDISGYAVAHAEREVEGRLAVADAMRLPFADHSFSAVISINTVHNLERAACVQALAEMQRLAPGRGYVQVDAYLDEDQRQAFEEWMLTAKTYGPPGYWREILAEAGYQGDYFWTILETDPEWTAR